MDGFETAAMIRSRRQTAQTPIIFVTAFNDEMHTAQGYSLGAVDYILSPVVPQILRTKVGVFVELYKKTLQVSRQAEERVALARAEAGRAAAEAANRRLAFLAEASNVLGRSLDVEDISRGLVRQAVPFLGDLCMLSLTNDPGYGSPQSELAWVDPTRALTRALTPSAGQTIEPLTALLSRVIATGTAETCLLLAEISAEPAGAIPNSPGELGLCAALAVPLQVRGQIYGALAIARRHPGPAVEPDEVSLIEDLAARAAVAIENARLYRHVEENDRRKNEFLAMLAHELRNPLAPIRTAAELLKMLELDNENLIWASEVISRQVEHLVRLVDDLLDISRITGGKIQLRVETIDARTVVDRAVETSRPLLDARKHTLALSVPAHPVPIKADPVRLAQVLANLLNNAAKYTEPGGKIDLELVRCGSQAVYSVRDNGVGISAEKLSAIFDLFTQVDHSLDRSQGGLGIGLTLVRRLIELHGGTVQATSEGANRGSQFVIRLPALDPAATLDSKTRPQSRDTAHSHARRILVVDDYPRVAESLMKMLALAGHEVRIALDGPTAVEEASTFRPEFIVLDIGLPGMDGYEVARQIRNDPACRQATLIAVTGYGKKEDQLRAYQAGFDHHLTKPVDCAVLLQLIGAKSTLPREHGSPSALLAPA
jgi:signal transduction histidine kinase/DNA-binding response OmpR family regulator